MVVAPAEVAPPAPDKFEDEYAWVDVLEVEQPVTTSASSAHPAIGSGRPSATFRELREQPSASPWEDVDEHHRSPEPIVSNSAFGAGSTHDESSSNDGSNGGSNSSWWEKVFV